MKLLQITRYPVKSLQGESVSSAETELDGLRGDRCWAIRDETTGEVLTARRAPQLLFAAATLAPGSTPVITLPTGVTCHGPGADTDAALSTWLDKPVRLVSSHATPAARAEYFADATDDTSQAIEWTMPTGRFVDAHPLLVLTTASLRIAAALYPDGDVRRACTVPVARHATHGLGDELRSINQRDNAPQSLGADDEFGVHAPSRFLTDRRGHCVIDEPGRALVEVGPLARVALPVPVSRGRGCAAFSPTSKSQRHPHGRRGSWRC
jgi:MOSC N-terminal beta barrel domain